MRRGKNATSVSLISGSLKTTRFAAGADAKNYNSGFNVGARAGAQWDPWRLEEEYSYRKNGLSSLGAFFGPNINTAFSGIRHTHSLMTNVIYDFSPGWAWPITPHIGFGIGAVNNVDGITLKPTNSGPTPSFSLRRRWLALRLFRQI